MPIDVTTAMLGLKAGIDTLRNVIGLVRDAKDLNTSSATQEAVTRSLDQADNSIVLAEAQIAQALGYTLCQCTWPPQIMRSIGYHRIGREQFQCPKCQKKQPSDQQLQATMDEDRLARELNCGGPNDWMAR